MVTFTRDLVSGLEFSDTDFFLASPLYRIVLFMKNRHFCEEFEDNKG